MKPKDLFLILIFLAFSWNSANTQTQIFKFAKTGTEIEGIEITLTDSIGNFYLIGRFNEEFNLQNDVISETHTDEYNELHSGHFILKLSPFGGIIWMHSLHIPGTTSLFVNHIQADVNNKGELAIIVEITNNQPPTPGNLIVANKEVTLDATKDNVVMAKFSKNGYLVWTKRVTATGGDNLITGKNIKLDESGNAFVAGDFNGDSVMFGTNKVVGTRNYSMIYIAKIAPNGSPAWASGCLPLTNSDSGNISIKTMEIDAGSNVLISGNFDGDRQFVFNNDTLTNTYSDNSYIARFTNSGVPDWVIPLEAFSWNISPQAINIDEEGKIIFTLFTNAYEIYIDGVYNYLMFFDNELMVIKLNTTGNILWTKTITTSLPLVYDSPPDVQVNTDDSSNIMLVGRRHLPPYDQIFFSQLNKSGDQLWDSTTTGANGVYLENATIDKYGNAYIAGQTYSNFSIAGENIEDTTGLGINYLIKMQNDGNIAYVKRKQNKDNNELQFMGMGVDEYENVFLVGNFYGNSANIGIHNLSANAVINDTGSFITKYSSIKNISGEVYNLEGSLLKAGKIVLIGYSYFQRSPMADTATIQTNGKFLFPNVPFGKYILLALPDDVGTIKYAPTYHVSAAHWINARPVIVNQTSSTENLLIFVPQLPVRVGTNTLAGRVTEIDYTDFASDGPALKAAMKKPKAGGKAHLARSKLKTDYEIIATTDTDENGDFSFNNVEDGSYVIIIEVAGLPNTSYHEVTVTGGMYVSNINYFISEEDIVAEGEPLYPEEPENTTQLNSNSDIYLYPNPGKDNFNVYIPEDHNLIQINIHDISGNIVHTQDYYDGQLRLDNIEPGIYLMNIKTDKEQRLIKLAINP